MYRVSPGTARRALRFAVSLTALSMAVPAFAADAVTITTPNASYSIDPATLAIVSRIAGGAETALASPGFEAGAVSMLDEAPTETTWRVTTGDAQFDFRAALDGNALVIGVTSASPAELAWPRGAATEAVDAYALPIFGEGRYIPADDAAWVAFLAEGYGSGSLTETLSMPMWTELRADGSVTWIVETPFDTKLSLQDSAGRLSVGVDHEFTRLDPGAEYRVRIEAGPADPVAGAKLYRQYLQATGQFKSLDEKIAANPDVARLGGAPHIYMWEKGPLKPEDITAWRRLVRQFGESRAKAGTLSAKLWDAFDGEARKAIEIAVAEAKGDSGFVSKYNQSVFTRALNAALPIAVPRPDMTPLSGGHDPMGEAQWMLDARAALEAEFPKSLAPAASWGSGMSTAVVAALQDAGIKSAWLGSEYWGDAIWHPEAVEAAKQAGYLVGIYDSYASAHMPELEGTWPTAQMGADIAANAGFLDANGKRVTGFNDRGAYVNPLAIVDYAQKRMAAVVEAAHLNSYFLDVDATGFVWSDYTPRRETTEAQTAAAQQARLDYAATTLGLVTGSEGGMALYAKDIAYAHGMTTPPFSWMDQNVRRNKQSEFFVGTYWPPEAPTLFFKPTPIPEHLRRVMFAPEFKLPLYEMALHDSVVTTHHWQYSSLKTVGERDRTSLLQMLYMIPPLYHLSTSVLDRDMPYIGAYLAAFAPQHARLFNQAMTGFTFLSDDRLVQQTSFADGTLITANFSDHTRSVAEGQELPAMSALIAGPDGGLTTIEMPALD